MKQQYGAISIIFTWLSFLFYFLLTMLDVT